MALADRYPHSDSSAPPDDRAPAPATGASFLLERHPAAQLQIPERFDEELTMIGRSADLFVEREILPVFEQLEALDYELSRAKMARAGATGLLGVEVPEAFGGLGGSKTAACLVAERLARSGSFNVTISAHASIGTLPLVYFGTPEQKARFLPGLADGTRIGAYCLTEPGSGSDSLAARTRARLSDDGRFFELSGTKMWISNAGFADLFTVFARVENGPDGAEGFTGFLVERDTPGLSLGAEERKMGIKGSSTRQVILEGARVPVENVLGEIGQGHRIALGVLNIGRLKLAASALGGTKEMLRLGGAYALTREQFGRPIAHFGLIQEKIGAIAADAYALESALYRLCGELDRRLASAGDEADQLTALNEYVVEYSFLKVYGSEIMDRAIDETLQVYGGYGFSADYPIELAYRNSRINRIFEGTNEINRMLAVEQLLKRAMRGRLPLLPAAQAASGGEPLREIDAPEPLRDALLAVENLKRAVLLVGGMAAQALGAKLAEEQEVMARLTDAMAPCYLAESALLRAEALHGSGRGEAAALLARLYAFAAVDAVRGVAGEALRRLPGGARARPALAAYLPEHGVDLIGLRREAAQAVYAAGGYPLR